MSQRHVTEVVGEIDPSRVYTTEGCMKFAGIGEQQLCEARKSGLVKAYHNGRRDYYRDYYRGSELIAWITREAK